MRCLALLCLALRDVRHAAIVYALLLPNADRNITTGWGDVARGSMALYLGSLARMMGRLDDAQAHLEWRCGSTDAWALGHRWLARSSSMPESPPRETGRATASRLSVCFVSLSPRRRSWA